nr:MAG TPA: hypothetical protein [Caudoviricetes sp.]
MVRVEFKNNGKEAILIVNDKELIVSEENMSLAFSYFNEKVE